MSDLGKLIRERRQDRRWSLRQLGEKIGVTPAYVADLEAGRRSPGAELKERIAATLDISPENLAAADTRLSADLRDWIEERPPLTAVLRSLHASPDSDRLIQRLGRFISRRSQAQPAKGFLITWESELRAMAAEASAWSIETEEISSAGGMTCRQCFSPRRQDQPRNETTRTSGSTSTICVS